MRIIDSRPPRLRRWRLPRGWRNRPSARDKEHQQIAADVRMLQVMQQEQSQQMQSLLGQLGEALKVVSQRLDDQAKASVKAFADQKLVIDALQRDLGVLREKVDDSNTRLGSVSQEVEALRQGLQQALQAAARRRCGCRPIRPTATSAAAERMATARRLPRRAAARDRRGRHVAQPPVRHGVFELHVRPVGSHHRRIQAFIRSFPKSDMADDAQVYIGNAYLQDGKNDKAVEAYDLAIRTYPSGNAIPEAYYKKGLALKNLKQIDLARAGLGIRRQDLRTKHGRSARQAATLSS